MRVLVATDKFAGTLSAPEAAAAVAEGWRRTSPGDEVTLLPLSDGGPGFRDTVAELIEQDPSTAYVESAEFCGRANIVDVRTGSTYPLGVAVRDAIAGGATRVVIGLGGSGTNDGGAGFLAALGATADVPLDGGPHGLRGVTTVDLSTARQAVNGVDLVAAADVDVPLLGLFGATKTFGEQKGLAEHELVEVDGILDAFVQASVGASPAERRVADQPGAGAAGGLGFAVLALGGTVVRGIDLVAEIVGLDAAAAAHDLVITGEGTFDHTSRAGKVVFGVGQRAAAAARPCIALAGQVLVGSRECRAMGIDAAYAMDAYFGLDAAMAEPHRTLAALAERVARTWASRD